MASPPGNPLDFTEFANALTPRLFRSALLMCGDWQLAEDLVQTTWANLYRSWRKVSAADNPTAYAHGALTKCFLSYRRTRSSTERPGLELIDRQSTDPDVATRLSVLDALSRLDKLDRAIVVLRYWEDRSVDETAAALGVRPGVVKTRSHRALKVLRRELGAWEEAS